MSEWETFCDISYYDLWRVRRKNERGFDDGFHLQNRKEAEKLVELLNELELGESNTKLQEVSSKLVDALRKQDGAIEKIERQAERIRQLEGATNHAGGTPLSIALSERDDALSQIVQAECRAERFCQERDEARNDIVGWKNKWECAVDMAARASIERDAALNKLKELKDILR